MRSISSSPRPAPQSCDSIKARNPAGPDDLPAPVLARHLRLRSDISQSGHVGLFEMEASSLDAIFGDDFEAVDVRSDS